MDTFGNKLMKKIFEFKEGESELLYGNYAIDDIYEACTACYDNKKKNIKFHQKIEYISKRIKAGHDSVTEHGFVSMIIKNIRMNSDTLIHNLTEIYNANHYLYIFTSTMEDDSMNIMIGGSIRGYRDLIQNITNYDNFIFRHIMSILQNATTREFFIDILEKCDMGDFDFFINVPDIFTFGDVDDEVRCHCYESCSHDICVEPFNLITLNEDIEVIDHPGFYEITHTIDKAYKYGFVQDEVEKIIPINVLFRNMSRTCTHQLVRHRNAITQESQRYVNYSNAGFTVPECDKEKFEISLFGVKKKIDLAELGKELCTVYKQLVDQGLKKEDARAYLPSNVQCKRIFMTFTLYTLRKFFDLRTDPHAQWEIRNYAEKLRVLLEEYYEK